MARTARKLLQDLASYLHIICFSQFRTPTADVRGSCAIFSRQNQQCTLLFDCLVVCVTRLQC